MVLTVYGAVILFANLTWPYALMLFVLFLPSILWGFGFMSGFAFGSIWVRREELERPGGRAWLAKNVGTRRVGLARVAAAIATVAIGSIGVGVMHLGVLVFTKK